jgi:hypothetical protein
MLSYGAVNFVQDLWFEQVVKRGWTDAAIPTALVPGARPIWLVILLLAALATVAFLRERAARGVVAGRSSSAAQRHTLGR